MPGRRPGEYARSRYESGLRSWRAGTRRYLAAAFGPLVVVGLLGVVSDPHLAAWGAGACFGLGVGLWTALRASPPAYVENWQTGAEGERKTARTLRRLDGGKWLAVHDVQHVHGNYDHVLVGPAGVFLLESKHPGSDAYLRDGQLWLRRRHDPQADCAEPRPRRRVLFGASQLSRELHESTGRPVWVKAVVVLWCAFEPDIHEDDRCVFIHGAALRDWLEQQPHVLAIDALRAYRAAIEEFTSMPVSGPASPESPRPGGARDVRSAALPRAAAVPRRAARRS
jgi:hypothetical protein